MDDEVSVTTDEVRAELSERGTLEFELAMAKAVNRKLARMLEQAKAGSDG